MPVINCPRCKYLIVDPSVPCSSCGEMYAAPSASQSAAQSSSSGGGYSAPVYSVFSIGTVLSLAFSTFFKHPFVFVGICVLAMIPGFFLSFLTLGMPILGLIAWFVSVALAFAAQGAIAFGVYEVLRGNAAQLGSSVSRGMSRIVSIFFAYLVMGFAMGVAFALGSFIIGILGFMLGMIGIVIPALILAFVMISLFCKWAVFVPVCAVERLGPIESLSRSSELTLSLRLQIFVLYVINFIILAIFGWVAWLLFGGLLIAAMATFSILGLLLLAVLYPFVISIPTAFAGVMTAVIYYELRGVKDGVGIDSLANIFD